VQPLKADHGAVQIVCAIFIAFYDWEKNLKKRQVKDPGHKYNHNAQQFNHLFNIELPMLQEMVHENEQAYHD